MIMETDYMKDFNEAVSLSIKHVKSETSEIETITDKMDADELNANELIQDALSGFFYEKNVCYDVDNCQEDSSDKSVCDSSSSLLVNIELCDDNSSGKANHITSCGADVEILEENNNNLNNSLDFTQIFQESVNSTLQLDDVHKTDAAQSVSDPIPGCSKDFDNAKLCVVDKNVHQEALQICKLLPKLRYETVHAALFKNCGAENRVELSLWDLLPYKRPMVVIPSKRKHTDNDCSVFELLTNIKQDKKQMNYIKQSHKPFSLAKGNIYDEDIVLVDDNLSNDSLRTMADKNNQLLQQLTKDNAPLKSTEHGILHPAKLILNRKQLYTKHATRSSSPIVYPSTLSYAISQQCEDQVDSITSVNTRKCNKGKSVRNKGVSLNLTTNSSNSFSNYMHYLDSIKTKKEQMLSGKWSERSNLQTQNDMKKYRNSNLTLPDNAADALATGIINFQNVSESASTSTGTEMFNVMLPSTSSTKALTAKNTNTTVCEAVSRNATIDSITPSAHVVSNRTDSVQSSSSSQSNSAQVMNYNDPLSETDDVILVEDFSESISDTFQSTSDSTQAFGGARRKEVNGNSDDTIKRKTQKEEKALLSKFQNEYDELVCAIPDLDKHDIRNMYKSYCKKAKYVNQDELLLKLIAHTQKSKSSTNPSEKQTLENEQLAHLSSIFPDADFSYLKKMLTRMYNDPDAIADFVESQCRNPTYQTKEEKLRRKRITEQQRQYIGKFDIKQFLKIFPDPFAHFEDPKRKCTFNKEAFQFLMSHFKQQTEDALKSVYSMCKYNLTLTVQALEISSSQITNSTNSSVCLWKTCPSEDIPLLQECAFLTHKMEIRDYMNRLKEEETKEFEELKRNNELLECQCCFDNECMPSKCSTCNDGHVFCNSCVLRGTIAKMSQGETRILCFENCGEEFNLPTLQKILSPTQFSIFIHNKQEVEVMSAKIEGLVSCPFCHFASIPPPEDKVFKCLNSECMKESCRLCKELSHIPLKCHEGKSEKARLLVEEKMTEALVRKCYRCARPYFKQDGCNKITCSCGALMCYICDKAIVAYDHFNQYSYGVPSKNKCPLWSDTDSMDIQTVRAVAEKAVEHVRRKDPNVRVNTNDLLRGMKRYKQTNSHVVLDRVQRLTRFDDT